MKRSFLSRFLINVLILVYPTITYGETNVHGECQMDLESAISMQENSPSDADIKKSYDELLCLAKAGDIEAKHEVFLTFYRSYPLLEGKAEEAFGYLVEAARQGLTDAQYNMGYLYSEGELVKEDKKFATEWLTLASNNGSTDASYILGVNYTLFAREEREASNTDNEQKFQEMSIHFLEIAVNSGHLKATSMLGVKLLATARDQLAIDRAITLLKKAALEGDCDSMLHLGDAYEVMSLNLNDGEMKKVSIDWYKQAAILGSEKALSKLNSLGIDAANLEP